MKRSNGESSEDYYSYIKALFRKHASVYAVFVDPLLSGIRRKVVEISKIERDAKILDFCTGTGGRALAFGKRGYEVVGIDLSKDMLKFAMLKNEYDHVRLQVADAARLPFKANQFDASCISYGLHEMPPEIRERVLTEMTRVTRLAEKIIIVDHTLPQNQLLRSVGYHLMKSIDSKYYPDFLRSNFETVLRKHDIKIKKTFSLFSGWGKIWKCVNEANNPKMSS